MVVIIKKKATRKNIADALRKLRNRKGFDAKQFKGRLNLTEEPVQIQKNMRDEWE